MVVLALILAFAAGLSVQRFLLDSNPTSGEASQLGQTLEGEPISRVQLSLEGRAFLGREDAPVTIVEFTDYQCPYCGLHSRENLARLLEEFPDKIKYTVVNFPITSIHPGADQAGHAAECAASQGKFWEYHDMLFQNQGSQHPEGLTDMALEVGLNGDEFNSCMSTGATAQRVIQDFEEGKNYGVRATPTFFINGRKVVGFLPYDDFKAIVDQAAGE